MIEHKITPRELNKSTLDAELGFAIDSCLYGVVDSKRKLAKAFKGQFSGPFQRYYFPKLKEGATNRPELLLVNQNCIKPLEGVIPVMGFIVCAAITDPYTRVEHELSITYDPESQVDGYLEGILEARRQLTHTPSDNPATAFVFK